MRDFLAVPLPEEARRAGSALAFVADRLVLFSSELKPGGSEYTERESYPFGPAARG